MFKECLAIISVVFTFTVLIFLILTRSRKFWRKQRVLAFFHPYCNGGGGGERVLWQAIEAILKDDHLSTFADIVIYSGESVSSSVIFDNVQKSFGIDLNEESRRKITICEIKSRFLLEAKWYPVATMVGQSIGSIIVGLECFLLCAPDYFCDTTGSPFIYPLAKYLAGCQQVIAYVHYPIISKDMLQRVREQRPAHNNNSHISSSVTISALKLLYYQIFAWCFSMVGSCATEVMVNSSWTCSHIASLWHLTEQSSPFYQTNDTSLTNIDNRSDMTVSHRLVKVFPPCNTTQLTAIPLTYSSQCNANLQESSRERYIISIGQFRPEKDHLLQLRAFKEFKDLVRNESKLNEVKLVMIGGTRNQSDEELVRSLQREADALGISKDIIWQVNATYSTLYSWLSKGSVGIHTMWNEHFGISVVEMMAAGLITVAHRSGGPLMDIVVPLGGKTTGYLAESPSEYAHCLVEAFSLSSKDALDLRQRARESSQRFSDESFSQAFVFELNLLLK